MHNASVFIHLNVYIVYIVYTHPNESKLLPGSIEVDIWAVCYLSNTWHAAVTPFSGQCDR